VDLKNRWEKGNDMARQEIGSFGLLSMDEIEEQKELMVEKLDSKIALSPSFGLWVKGVPHYSWHDEDGVVLGMILGAKMVTPQGAPSYLLYDVLFTTGHKRSLVVYDFMVLSDDEVDELWDEEEELDYYEDFDDDEIMEETVAEIMEEIFEEEIEKACGFSRCWIGGDAKACFIGGISLFPNMIRR
jgi:hypothetical protein